MAVDEERDAFEAGCFFPIEMAGAYQLPVVGGFPQFDDFQAAQAGVDFLAGAAEDLSVADAFGENQRDLAVDARPVWQVPVEEGIRLGHARVEVLCAVARQIRRGTQREAFKQPVVPGD